MILVNGEWTSMISGAGIESKAQREIADHDLWRWRSKIASKTDFIMYILNPPSVKHCVFMSAACMNRIKSNVEVMRICVGHCQHTNTATLQ